jgi:hypothetical protein
MTCKRDRTQMDGHHQVKTFIKFGPIENCSSTTIKVGSEKPPEPEDVAHCFQKCTASHRLRKASKSRPK